MIAARVAAAVTRVAIVAAAAIVAVGCAGPEKPKPTALEPIVAKANFAAAWTHRIDAVRYPLSVATSPNVFTLAGGDGSVVALQADTGRELWRGQAGAAPTAGVGSDGRFAALVTRNGELTTLEAGRVLWSRPIEARVVTAPLVAGERVFVLAVDRSVHAFDAATGAKLWTARRPGEPLLLSQPGVIAPFKDTLLVGQGGRLAGLDPNTGGVRWEANVGNPRGTNEIERLADLVGPAARTGDVVCVRSFQAAVGCINGDRGASSWTRNVGGTTGLAADDRLVYGADASDRLTAWRLANGEPAWTSEALMYRGLAAPAATGRHVVFGDAEGMVHVLARDSGEAQQRLTTDGSAIVATTVGSGTLLVVTQGGGLFAFRPD